MRLLYVSDVHYDYSKKREWDILIEALNGVIKEERTKKRFDAMLISGDLIDKGRGGYDSIEKAFEGVEREVLIPIKNELEISKDRIFITPGNHDMDRKSDDFFAENRTYKCLDNEDMVEEFIKRAIDRQEYDGMKRTIPFKNFIKKFHEDIGFVSTPFYDIYKLELENEKIAICCINTSWRCYDSSKDFGRIIIGKEVYTRIQSEIKDCTVKIGIMHHHFSALCDFDKEQVAGKFERLFDILIFGHIHTPIYKSSITQNNSLITIIGGQLNSAAMELDSVKYGNAFCVIDLERENNKFKVEIKSYSYDNDHDRFVINNRMGDNGISSYTFESREKVITNMAVFNEGKENSADKKEKYLYMDKMGNVDFAFSPTSIDISQQVESTILYRYIAEIKHLLEMFCNKFVNGKQYDLELVLLLIDKIIKKHDLSDYAMVLAKQIFGEADRIITYTLLNDWLDFMQDLLACSYQDGKNEPIGLEEVINLLEKEAEEKQLDDFQIIRDAHSLYKAILNKNELYISRIGEPLKKLYLVFPLICCALLAEKKEFFFSETLKEPLQAKVPLYLETYSSKIKEVINENNGVLISGKKGIGKKELALELYSEYKHSKDISVLLFFECSIYSNSENLVKGFVEACNDKLIKKIKYTDFDVVENSDGVYWSLVEKCLESLRLEYKNIFLIFNNYQVVEEKLSTIILSLCKNIKVVYVVQSSNKVKLESIETIHIEKITLESVDLLSKTGDNWLNSQIFKVFDGDIYGIKEFMDRVKDKGIENITSQLEKVRKDKSMDLRNKADMWIDKTCPFLEEILLLLSIFHDVSALSLEQIQDFLVSIKREERLPKISIEIMKKGDFLYHNEKGDIKLNDNDFSQYICNNYFSKRDFLNFINHILNWLKDSDEYRLIALFISKNKGISSKYEEILVEKVDKFMLDIREECSERLLYKIGLTIHDEFMSQKELALSFLYQAAHKKSIDAMEFLGFYLLREGAEETVSSAQKYLEDAIALNSYKARYFYALGIINRYFKSETDDSKAMEFLENVFKECEDVRLKVYAELLYVQYNLERKMSYLSFEKSINRLEELAKTNENAMYILAKYCIQGIFVSKNIDRGIALLNCAIERGFTPAGVYLATCYIYGREGVEQDIKQGIGLLRTLEDTKDNLIKITLIQAFFDGYVEDVAVDDMLNTLQALIEEGNKEAKFLYSEQALYGKKEGFDENQAIELLKSMGEDREAFCRLGDYYASNRRNFDLAVNYFKKAISLGSLVAKVDLANIYLDSKGGKYNEAEAVELLESASETLHPYARTQLAQYYLKSNKGLNQERGIEILESIIDVGNSKAERMLGEILLDSRYKYVDVERGERLLTQAVYRGNTKALFILVQNYIKGDILNKNLNKAEELLLYAIERKDEIAEALYGKYILQGVFENKNQKEGLDMLFSLVERNNIMAKFFLGKRQIIGDNVPQNKEEGEKLLLEASEKLPEAMYELAEYKLSGNYLKKDVEVGKKLLEKAYVNGDADAALALANRLLDGKSIEQDISKALNIFRELIDSGDENARIEYAMRQVNGDGIAKNIEAGEKSLLELIENDSRVARRVYIIYLLEGKLKKKENRENVLKRIIELADENIQKGDYETAYILGKSYVDGKNVPMNVEKGIELLEKGASEHHVACTRYLGRLLLEGDLIKRNTKRAIELLEQCIERGDLEAKYYYAKCNIEGYVMSDSRKGWEIMEQLVSDGHLESKFYMANSCIKGTHRLVDTERGIELFEQVILENDAYADAYSELLITNQYLEKNEKRTFEILQKAICNGHYDSIYTKAKRLMTGKGCKKDSKKAVKNFEKIIERMPEAKFELGIRYKYGINVKQDVKKGNELIKQALDKIENQASPLLDKHMLALIAYNLKDYELASRLFEECYLSRSRESLNSMAYMIRRGEFCGDVSRYPTVEELLAVEIEANSYIAKINLALYICQNTNDESKWREADKIIGSLNGYDDCVEWWYNLMEEDDDEGKLVLAWLLRHNKLWNTNNLNQKELLDDIKKNGGTVLDWMYEQV